MKAKTSSLDYSFKGCLSSSLKPLSYLVLIILISVISPDKSEAKKTVMFFDPDANLTNIVKVKGALQRYLRKIDPKTKFQPITKYKTFQRLIKRKKPDLLIISSHYYKAHAESLSLKPVFIAEKQGKLSYSKILLTKSEASKGSVSIKSIATTSTRDYVKSLDFKKANIKAANLSVIQVTKDIDALLALSYGQVESALLVPDSLEYLKAANPESVKGMKKVFNTPKTINPVLCVVGDNKDSEMKAFLDAFKNISNDKDGKAFMNFLGYSKWITPPKKIIKQM